MNGIHFGIPNAWRSDGFHIVDSHGALMELALLKRCREGLERSEVLEFDSKYNVIIWYHF